jgi:hypothetical protein
MDAEKLTEMLIHSLQKQVDDLENDKLRLQHEVDELKKAQGTGTKFQKKDANASG